MALVGETGSGKSVTMLAALGLLPPTATVGGAVHFAGGPLLGLERRALDRLRGKALTIVFQEPQSALDPLYTVGSQVAAVLRHGLALPRRAAWARAVALLDEVGIPEPARRAKSYPHELSGGQRQRVAIAMAVACNPQVLIADEPTTALDATVAAKVMALLADLKARRGMALVLISHDLALVRRVADRVLVMQAGRLVESGPVDAIIAATGAPLHADAAGRRGPAARAHPVPRDRRCSRRATSRALSPARRLRRRPHERLPRSIGVSLTVGAGETLGLIGESGSGKSSLGRALLRLEPAEGRILYEGRDLASLSPAAMRPLRRSLQIVFQDPFSSLSPRLTRGGDRRGGPADPRARPIGGGPRAARGAGAGRGRPRRGFPRAPAGRTVGRPAPARRHRPRDGAGAAPRRARRADLGARPLRAGGRARACSGGCRRRAA